MKISLRVSGSGSDSPVGQDAGILAAGEFGGGRLDVQRPQPVFGKAAHAQRGIDGAQALQAVVAGFEDAAGGVILAAAIEGQAAADAQVAVVPVGAEAAFAQPDGVAPFDGDQGQGMEALRSLPSKVGLIRRRRRA